jgi:hypothetical protein
MNTKRRVRCSVCGKEVSARIPKGGDGSEDYPAYHKDTTGIPSVFPVCRGTFSPATTLPELPKESEG